MGHDNLLVMWSWCVRTRIYSDKIVEFRVGNSRLFLYLAYKYCYTVHMKKGIKRFLKYSSVGVSTFGLDLVILFALTEIFKVPYLFSTGFAFIIAVSLNYYMSRRFVFSKTSRKLGQGYYMFVSIATLALFVILALMSLFVEVLGLDYMISRIIIGGIIGVCNYIVNLFVTFKVVGQH